LIEICADPEHKASVKEFKLALIWLDGTQAGIPTHEATYHLTRQKLHHRMHVIQLSSFTHIHFSYMIIFRMLMAQKMLNGAQKYRRINADTVDNVPRQAQQPSKTIIANLTNELKRLQKHS
jgi:hypothetical protein